MRKFQIAQAMLGLLTTATRGQDNPSEHSKMEHATMTQSSTEHHHDEGMAHEVNGFYGAYPMSREASGTSWQPEATPMTGLHFTRGDWMFMLHGFADVIYDHQGGKRGDDGFYSPNMLMLMGNRPLGAGT